MNTPLRGIGPPGDNEVLGLIMGDNHRYAMWDAAYVLGSLSASDRREFEVHMAAARRAGRPSSSSAESRPCFRSWTGKKWPLSTSPARFNR